MFPLLIFSFIISVFLHPLELWATATIVGGKNTTSMEKPWVVRIRLLSNETLCSGTLISSNWVITGAHCFPNSHALETFVVEGGGTGRLKDLKTLSKIQSIHKHPNNVRNGDLWDVVLVELATKVKFSANLNAIRLKDLSNLRLSLGDEVNISGWGNSGRRSTAPTQLQTMTAQVVKPIDIGVGIPKFLKSWGFDKEGHLVTINNYATCNGDSGTGWIMDFAGENFLVGIHTAGDFCKGISVGIELTHLLPFITTVTKIIASE